MDYVVAALYRVGSRGWIGHVKYAVGLDWDRAARCLGLDNFRFNCRITCLVPDDQIQYTFSASIVVHRTEVEATDFGTKKKGKCDWPPREWLVRSE